MSEEPDLAAAFALTSDAERLRFYRDWAPTYDRTFAEAMDYQLPANVAAVFIAEGGAGPVLDVGAGTGLLAEALRAQGFGAEIDAIDLSPDMLKVAGAKGLYRALAEANVTLPLPLAGGYAGVVSTGTFTSGHVGPEALERLLEVAASGALFALSVNAVVYASRGFDRALAGFGPRITGLRLVEVPIYGPAAIERDPEHAAQKAQVVLFRKT